MKITCNYSNHIRINMKITYLKGMFNKKVIENTNKEMKEHKEDFANFIIKKKEKELYVKQVIRLNNKVRNDVGLIKENVKDNTKALKKVESDIEREIEKIKTYRKCKESRNRFTKKEYKLILVLNELYKRNPVKKETETNNDSLPFLFKTALLMNE